MASLQARLKSREVVLTPERWVHILVRHGEMAGHRDAILRGVHEPTLVRRGSMPGEMQYLRRGSGPSTWLFVVVHYDDRTGRITTAFGRRWIP